MKSPHELHALCSCDDSSAHLANGLVELSWSLEGCVRLDRLRDAATRTDWIAPPCPVERGCDDHFEALVTGRSGIWPALSGRSAEFEVHYALTDEAGSLNTVVTDDQGGTSTRVVTGEDAGAPAPDACRAEVADGVARLDLAWDLADHPFRIVLHYELRAGVAAVRRWTTVTHTGIRPIALEKVLSWSLALHRGNGPLDVHWVEAFRHPSLTGKPPLHQCALRSERLGGSQSRRLRSGPYPRCDETGSVGSMAWLALRSPRHDAGLWLGWEWSGDFDVELGDFEQVAGSTLLRAGLSVEGDYRRLLEPGESFTTPTVMLGTFTGDEHAAGQATRRVAERVLGLPWPEGKPPSFVGYDTWCDWERFTGPHGHLQPDRLDREIDRCAELGVELFIIDYDWFPRVGDWWVDAERFPDGLEPYCRRIREAGMKVGLWMGFGQAHKDSRVAREHPEYLATRNGSQIVGGWGLAALCLGYPPCRDWVIEQVANMVQTCRLDWIKHDFDLLAVSDAHHHAPKATDSRFETVEGYYHIMDELHRRFPRLYLDNWTPVTGGADFGNFQRHHSTLLADWYTPVHNRQVLAGITHLFPPTRLHAYHRVFDPREERSPYAYRSSVFGNGMYLLNDILRWDQHTMAVAAEQVRQLKADRELFEGGEITNLLTAPPGHHDWEARMVWNQALQRGMIQVFRNADPDTSRTIHPLGLDPQRNYRVKWTDAGETIRASGRDIASQGLSVSLHEPFSSERLTLSAM